MFMYKYTSSSVKSYDPEKKKDGLIDASIPVIMAGNSEKERLLSAALGLADYKVGQLLKKRGFRRKRSTEMAYRILMADLKRALICAIHSICRFPTQT